jgi:hypothetical protein
MALFYIFCLLPIAEHGDDSFGHWYLHAQELLPYDSVKFVHELRTMCGSRTGGWSLPFVMSD